MLTRAINLSLRKNCGQIKMEQEKLAVNRIQSAKRTLMLFGFGQTKLFKLGYSIIQQAYVVVGLIKHLPNKPLSCEGAF